MPKPLDLSGVSNIDYSKFSGKSHPALDPVRGDTLPDSRCCEPMMTADEFARAEAYRARRLQAMRDRLKARQS